MFQRSLVSASGNCDRFLCIRKPQLRLRIRHTIYFEGQKAGSGLRLNDLSFNGGAAAIYH